MTRPDWTLGLGALLLVGCSDPPETKAPAPEKPGPPCASDDDCAETELCATGRVKEISLEDGDDTRCIAKEKVIGNASPTWSFAHPGDRPLADRLCLAGGLDRGASASADARRARQKDLLKASGVRMIRVDFPWATIEPEKGKLDFSELDPLVDAASSIDLEVIGIIAYGVPWASSLTDSDPMYPPDDPADYANYARALATHYAGKVRRWELWNEPNGGWRFFRPKLHGDAAQYAKMMAAAATAIHEACVDCKVYSAGLFFHEQLINGAIEFTDDMLTAEPDAFVSIDGYGWHPYPTYPPEAQPEDNGPPERSVSGMVDDIAAVFAAHQKEAPPLAVTEFGWPSYKNVSEPLQAAFLVRETLLGAALGNDPLCWFTLGDGPKHGAFPPEDDFGLYRFDSQNPSSPVDPKPARDALALLAELGQGAKPKGASKTIVLHDLAQGRFALDFEAPGGTWTALWQLENTPAPLHLEGEARHAVDLTGKLLAQPENGSLDVEVTDAPIYLVP